MLVQLIILPLRGGRHISDELAEAVKIIDASGLPYRVGPSGTCIEGDWDAVMPVIRRCHEAVRSLSAHVVTLITIEDEQGKDNKLTSNVTAVEHRIGRSLGRTARLITADTPPSHP